MGPPGLPQGGAARARGLGPVSKVEKRDRRWTSHLGREGGRALTNYSYFR